MQDGVDWMSFYPAFVEYEEGCAYGVIFPDLPGCFSAADEFDDVFSNAAEALSLHVECLMEDDMEVPKPSTPEILRKNAEWNEWFKTSSLIMVPLLVNVAKPKRVNISLNPSLLSAIDQAAAQQNMTRSAFLASAAVKALT